MFTFYYRAQLVPEGNSVRVHFDKYAVLYETEFKVLVFPYFYESPILENEIASLNNKEKRTYMKANYPWKKLHYVWKEGSKFAHSTKEAALTRLVQRKRARRQFIIDELESIDIFLRKQTSTTPSGNTVGVFPTESFT